MPGRLLVHHTTPAGVTHDCYNLWTVRNHTRSTPIWVLLAAKGTHDDLSNAHRLSADPAIPVGWLRRFRKPAGKPNNG
jgi:hypothetical protein